MKNACSGIILSGGLNTRMKGENKALLSVGGRTILDRLYDTFQGVFEEVVLVTNDPLQYLSWDLTIVADLFGIRSSLTGIHAGLFHSSHPHAFITACDAPFLKRELIVALIEELEPRWDVVIPITQQGHEPLCAIYSKRCIKAIEQQLEKEDHRITNFFSKVRVKEVPEERLRSVDPELASFININTPEDLGRAVKNMVE